MLINTAIYIRLSGGVNLIHCVDYAATLVVHAVVPENLRYRFHDQHLFVASRRCCVYRKVYRRRHAVNAPLCGMLEKPIQQLVIQAPHAGQFCIEINTIAVLAKNVSLPWWTDCGCAAPTITDGCMAVAGFQKTGRWG